METSCFLIFNKWKPQDEKNINSSNENVISLPPKVTLVKPTMKPEEETIQQFEAFAEKRKIRVFISKNRIDFICLVIFMIAFVVFNYAFWFAVLNLPSSMKWCIGNLPCFGNN